MTQTSNSLAIYAFYPAQKSIPVGRFVFIVFTRPTDTDRCHPVSEFMKNEVKVSDLTTHVESLSIDPFHLYLFEDA